MKTYTFNFSDTDCDLLLDACDFMTEVMNHPHIKMLFRPKMKVSKDDWQKAISGYKAIKKQIEEIIEENNNKTEVNNIINESFLANE